MSESRRRGGTRLWVVPPGLMTHEEPFEGYRVLDEVRSAAGVTLWEFIRDIDLWSTTDNDGRARLFATGSARRRRERIAALDEAVELRAPLESVGRAMEGRVRSPGALMSQACHALAEWAEQQGLPQTALAFAQSAALATPDLAPPAYFVGQLARRNAEYRRAETWYRRTLGLARRRDDWRHYGLACLGLGNLNRQRGDYPTARSWYLRALRVARRNGLLDVRALALHDLFCVAANRQQVEEAEIWAERALRELLRVYGRGHARLEALAHDVARFYLLTGRNRQALHVFRGVLPRISRISERRMVSSNMALAAARVGDRLTFATKWSETWRLVDEYEDVERVAESLVSLAEGALEMGDPDRAQLAATHALRIATQRNEAEQRLAAEQVLDSLRRTRVRPRLEAPSPDEVADAAFAEEVPSFAESLVEALGGAPAIDYTD
jgi:tetratricopeptide (TPR) repeat protein